MKTLTAVAFLAVALNAFAAPPGRTFVASTGLDTNPCSRTSPCRSFSVAIAAVASGGEVVVLDSAGYGPTTITTSVTVVAPSGVYAGVTATSGDGMTIDTGLNGAVTLRGLTINNTGSANNGIDFITGTELVVQHVVVQRFFLNGILVATGSPATTRVEDCSVAQGGGAGIKTTVGTVTVVGSYVEDNAAAGLWANGGVIAAARCVLEGNDVGITVDNVGGDITLHDSVVMLNNFGIFANSGATGRVSRTLITKNGGGVSVDMASSIASFGNNELGGNTTDGSFTASSLGLH